MRVHIEITVRNDGETVERTVEFDCPKGRCEYNAEVVKCAIYYCIDGLLSALGFTRRGSRDPE